MTKDHVANLEKARDQLVEQRRSLAETLAAGQRGVTEKEIDLFLLIQNVLPAVEDAIADERRRAPQRGASGATEREPS
jgi:septal ring factor EnvC (AmiA/AmiB activator)